MPDKLTEFDAAEYIETVEDARQHLELCAEQDPGDGSAIRAALNTISRAPINPDDRQITYGR
jgi:DNA-binding phage protein